MEFICVKGQLNFTVGRLYAVSRSQANLDYYAIDDRGISVKIDIEDFESSYAECPIVVQIGTDNTTKIQTLPTDSAHRKTFPILSGCLNYFPAAIAGVSHISKLGNDKHNPGQPLHHSRDKSTDHGDCIVRHLLDVEDLISAYKKNNPSVTVDMILLEANQMVWRALAYSQLLHEKFGYPVAPGAKNE